MKQMLKQTAASLGLEKPARRVWATMKAKGWTPWEPLVPADSFSDCVSAALRDLRNLEPPEQFGDYLEFGVSRGTSLACVYKVLQRENLQHARLIGFDSFQGMPVGAEEEGWMVGGYHSTQAATRHYLKSQGVDFARITLVEGWFRDTLIPQTRATLGICKASLLMIDCDIYSASKDALAFSEPHIKGHAIIIFDDWGPAIQSGHVGQREAFDEFLGAHPNMRAEPLAAYSENSRVFLVSRAD